MIGLSEVKADISSLLVNTTNGENGVEFLARHLNNCNLTSSISDIRKNEYNIHIFPNPAINHFFIKGFFLPFEIDIFDINGQILKSIKNFEIHHPIDISSLSNGYYFIQLKDKSNNLIVVKKLIKL